MCGQKNSYKWAALFLILVSFNNFALANKVIYVDDDAAGANDGSSWQNAYNFLQDALADANTAEKPVEIHVAQGIYKPDQGEGQTAGDRNAAFRLINDVTLSGGFAGILKSDPNKQNIEEYETVLSGDLAGNDIEINDPDKLLEEPTRSENSLTIIWGAHTDSTSLLDGFTIKGGNNNIITEIPIGSGLSILSGKSTITNCTFSYNSGAPALRNTRSDPLITNCRFYYNFIGMTNDHSNATITYCNFSKNRVAIELISCDNLIVTKCQFTENYGNFGGAIYNYRSVLTLKDCSFTKNSSYNSPTKGGGNGGAIYNTGGTLILTNCFFIGNYAEGKGAGIYTLGYNLTLINCTFATNISKDGTALACESMTNISSISNCILWNDGNEIWYKGSSISVDYSDVKGGLSSIYDPNNGLIWGDRNIFTDPLFADPNKYDYHLKSQSGRWYPNNQTWIKDDVTSPCIDAGDPNSPIGYEPFPNGGYINMGVYGGTSEASKSYFGMPICETIVAGDINGDCKVDELDMEIMMLHWLEEH